MSNDAYPKRSPARTPAEKEAFQAVVSARIDALCRSSGMQNIDIAAATGIKPTQISNHRRGVGDPPGIINIIRYADFFHVSVDWILGRTTDESKRYPEEFLELYDLYQKSSAEDKLVIKTLLQRYKSE